jgi:Uma2 family endonuclease
MADAVQRLEERFTYGDYRTWPDEERWELIEGVAYSMSPAPQRWHQEIQARLITGIRLFLKGKPCKAFGAPFDVILPRADESDDEVDTVVQPDIVVFGDRSKLTKAGARGAPDMVVEILSPSTSKKDQREKFDLYEKHGVREYWIVDPTGAWLCVYRLKPDGLFDSGELRESLREYGPIESRVLEGFAVDPGELFAED